MTLAVDRSDNAGRSAGRIDSLPRPHGRLPLDLHSPLPKKSEKAAHCEALGCGQWRERGDLRADPSCMSRRAGHARATVHRPGCALPTSERDRDQVHRRMLRWQHGQMTLFPLSLCVPLVSALITISSMIACGHGSAATTSAALPPAAVAPMSSVGTVALSITDDGRRDRVDATHARQWIAQLYYPITPAPVTGVYADDPVLLDLLVAEKYYFATEAQLRGWARKPAAAVAGAPPRTPAALPVVTISPGLGFARLNYAELAAALVARG